MSSCKEGKDAGSPEVPTTRPIKCRDGTLVYPFSIPPRDKQLDRLKQETFDVLIIGGGCVGAGGRPLALPTRGLGCCASS